jgi:carbonic anhydrase
MIDGIFYAAEMHLVHKDPVTGQLAVVTVLLKLHAGDVDNPELAQFFPQASNTYNVTVKVRLLARRSCFQR